MGLPAITNVWATRFFDPVTGNSSSRLVIEATSLPGYRVRSVADSGLQIDLPNSMLVMAPDTLQVNDGLVSKVTVVHQLPCPRVIVRLDHASSWTVSEVQEAPSGPGPARLVIDLDRKPIRDVFRGKLVAIDPGHGGRDTGGRGPVSLVEKKVALEIGRLLAGILRREGAEVIMTRTSDEDVPSAGRFAHAKSECADVLISIHAFSSKSCKISGSRTLYSKETEEESRLLAECIQASLIEKLQLTDRGIAKNPLRIPPGFEIPYVVVEVATISNWLDEAQFRSPTIRQRAAEALATGLKRYFLFGRGRGNNHSDVLTKLRAHPAEIATLPIRTHLIGEGEDLVEVIRRYVGGIAKPGDVVVVAETVVSITQGRAVLPDSVRPSVFARVLCKLPSKGGNLATPPAMQLAIDEVGLYRVMLGVAAGGIGRLMGRRGDFFRVAGSSLAQIDDVASTCPPFDKHVVLGPVDPGEVAKKIKHKVGVDIAIVDVNDLGRVDVLAITDDKALAWVTKALKSNPLGNDDQQTPIAILRPIF